MLNTLRQIVQAFAQEADFAASVRLLAHQVRAALDTEVCSIYLLNDARDGYRLAAARRRYNLPDYQQHDALSDALAAGELFLAQLTRMTPAPRLGSLEAW